MPIMPYSKLLNDKQFALGLFFTGDNMTLHTFLSNLPMLGWYIIFTMLVLYGILHALEGFHSHRLALPFVVSIQRIKRLFKPSLLVVSGVMSVVAILSTYFA